MSVFRLNNFVFTCFSLFFIYNFSTLYIKKFMLSILYLLVIRKKDTTSSKNFYFIIPLISQRLFRIPTSIYDKSFWSAFKGHCIDTVSSTLCRLWKCICFSFLVHSWLLQCENCLNGMSLKYVAFKICAFLINGE